MKAGLLSLMLLLATTAQARDEDSPFDVEPSPPNTSKAVVVKPTAPAEEASKPKPQPVQPTEEVVKKPVETTKSKTAISSETTAVKAKVKVKNETTAKTKPIAETVTSKNKTTTETPIAKAKAKPTTDAVADKKKSDASTEQSSKKKASITTTEPVKPKAIAEKPVPQPKPTPSPVLSAVTISANTTGAVSSVTVPTLSNAEQRQQQILINNAEKIDNMNRELLTQNQSLQLANEKLTLQVELLQHDRSSEYMRDGALAIIIGLFLGWAISGNTRRHSKWS